VQVQGRIVDFESCMSAAGCQGVAALRVSLFQDSAVISNTTQPDGAFVLRGVPGGSSSTLLVTDAGGQGVYLSSLQAIPVKTAGSDVFGVEIFALQRQGGLYEAMGKEAAVDLGTHALYLGQVYVLDAGKMKALLGATAQPAPGATVRYVDCNPRFKSTSGSCSKALFDTARTTTGPFGEFLMVAASAGEATVAVTAPDRTFGPVSATLGMGYITIGLHQASAAATVDGGAPKDRGAKDQPRPREK
jgi:hypothetical protein